MSVLLTCFLRLAVDFRDGHGHDSLLSDQQEGHRHRLNAGTWTRPSLPGNEQSAVTHGPTFFFVCFIVKEIIDVKMHQNKTADVFLSLWCLELITYGSSLLPQN